ncbi:MAG: ATP-binding protein, partial [Bacteroidota bacterium]
SFAQNFPPSKGARGMLSGNFARNIPLTPFKRGNYTVLSPSIGKNLPDKRERVGFNILSFIKQNSIALLLLGIIINHCQAQDYTASIRHWGVEEGLSHREVHVVFRDKMGFLWTATRFGLNRFDGYHFKTYTTETHGYDFNNISRIGQDNGGWLWLWDEESIVFLHPQKELIQSVAERFPDGLPFEIALKKVGSWKFHRFREMVRDDQGLLYFTNNEQQQLLTFSTKTGFTAIPLEKKYTNLTIKLIAPNGHIWANDAHVLVEITPEGRILSEYPLSTQSLINEVYFSENTICLTAENIAQNATEAFRLNESQQLEKIIFNEQATTVAAPSASTFWTSKEDGFQVFNFNGQLIRQFSIKDFPTSFYHINHRLTDPFGNIWIGHDFGLTQIKTTPNRFRRHFYFSEENQRPYNNSARGIAQMGDQLLVNFEMGGLTQITPQGNETPNWQLLNRGKLPLDKANENGIYDYWSRPILHNGNDQFWIGDKDHLGLFDPVSQTLKTYPYQLDDTQTQPVDIWSLFIARDQTVWAGTGNGLVYKKTDQDSVQLLKKQAAKWAFSEAVVLNFIPKDDRFIWLCTNRGLYLFDVTRKEIVERYWSKGDGSQYLPVDNIKYLYEDSLGTRWLATDGGLIRWDQSGEKRVFTQKDGLPNNNLYVVYEDENDHLWMSSDYGIIQFDKKSFAVKTYLPKDGLSFHEFNRISHFRADDGRIYLGSMNGITSFHPKDFYQQESANQPPLVITNYQYLDGDHNQMVNQTSQLQRHPTIELRPNDRLFTLEFALLNYEEAAVNQYAYKIPGVYDDWLYQPDRKIQLGRLPHGQQTLLIKGMTTSGVPIEELLTLQLNVLRPYYLQAWFLALIISSAVISAYTYSRWKSKTLLQRQSNLEKAIDKATKKIKSDKAFIEAQAKNLKALNATKDQLFTIIGHDLRKPALSFKNISKKVNFLIQQKEWQTLEQFGNSIEKNAYQLNSLLDNLLNWALQQRSALPYRPQSLDMNVVFAEQQDLFQQRANDKQIDLTYWSPDGTSVYADAGALSTILRNLIDNALKFTPSGGKVQLEAIQQDQQVRIRVADSGVGMTDGQIGQLFDSTQRQSQRGTDGERGTGLGLSLVKSLVERNRGGISVVSVVGEGTVFEVWLPTALIDR